MTPNGLRQPPPGEYEFVDRDAVGQGTVRKIAARGRSAARFVRPALRQIFKQDQGDEFQNEPLYTDHQIFRLFRDHHQSLSDSYLHL